MPGGGTASACTRVKIPSLPTLGGVSCECKAVMKYQRRGVLAARVHKVEEGVGGRGKGGDGELRRRLREIGLWAQERTAVMSAAGGG